MVFLSCLRKYVKRHCFLYININMNPELFYNLKRSYINSWIIIHLDTIHHLFIKISFNKKKLFIEFWSKQQVLIVKEYFCSAYTFRQVERVSHDRLSDRLSRSFLYSFLIFYVKLGIDQWETELEDGLYHC
jgi:hypothetical protein